VSIYPLFSLLPGTDHYAGRVSVTRSASTDRRSVPPVHRLRRPRTQTQLRRKHAGLAGGCARHRLGRSGSINQAGAGRFFQGGGQRPIFRAFGAANRGYSAQVILRLIAVTLFDLPQTIILPGQHVVRVGFQRALVPDLRELLIAEFAIGVTDQIGNVGEFIVAERPQLPDRGGIIVAVVDRRIGCAVSRAKIRARTRGPSRGPLLAIHLELSANMKVFENPKDQTTYALFHVKLRIYIACGAGLPRGVAPCPSKSF